MKVGEIRIGMTLKRRTGKLEVRESRTGMTPKEKDWGAESSRKPNRDESIFQGGALKVRENRTGIPPKARDGGKLEYSREVSYVPAIMQ